MVTFLFLVLIFCKLYICEEHIFDFHSIFASTIDFINQIKPLAYEKVVPFISVDNFLYVVNECSKWVLLW